MKLGNILKIAYHRLCIAILEHDQNAQKVTSLEHTKSHMILIDRIGEELQDFRNTNTLGDEQWQARIDKEVVRLETALSDANTAIMWRLHQESLDSIDRESRIRKHQEKLRELK